MVKKVKVKAKKNKKNKVRDEALPDRLRGEAQEEILAEKVSNYRKSRNEELEQLRQSRVTHANAFFNSNLSDTNSVSSDNRQKPTAYDYGNLNTKKINENFRKLSMSSNKSMLVFDINEFYKEQRRKNYMDRKKKTEASDYMHRYSRSINDQFSPRNFYLDNLDNSSVSASISARISNARKFEDEASVRSVDDRLYSMTDFFVNKNYRSFVFATHEKHGILLLHCTRKKKKGPHFQVPGGHIDESEFVSASKVCGGDPRRQLILASKNAVVRELWEETGIDVRGDLTRLTPTPLRFDFECNNELNNEHKKRLFYSLELTDDDFFGKDDENDSTKLTAPFDKSAAHLLLKLSVEHSGFIFEKDLERAVEKLEYHSGGACSEALKLALIQKTAKMPNSNAIRRIIDQIEDENKTTTSILSGSNRAHDFRKRREFKRKISNVSNELSIINNMDAVLNDPYNIQRTMEQDEISNLASSYGESNDVISLSTLDTDISDPRGSFRSFVDIVIPIQSDLLPEQNLDDEDESMLFESYDAREELSDDALSHYNPETHSQIPNTRKGNQSANSGPTSATSGVPSPTSDSKEVPTDKAYFAKEEKYPQTIETAVYRVDSHEEENSDLDSKMRKNKRSLDEISTAQDEELGTRNEPTKVEIRPTHQINTPSVASYEDVYSEEENDYQKPNTNGIFSCAFCWNNKTSVQKNRR